MNGVELFGIYVLAVMGIGYAVNALLAPLFGRGWRLFVAPGIILHELAHVLGCVLTGADIHEINFWKASGGHVIHGPPKIPLIGSVLISFAPMLFMTFGLYLVLPYLPGNISETAWASYPSSSLVEFVSGYLRSVGTMIGSSSWIHIGIWILIYLMLNIAVTITPSWPDLKNSAWALGGLLIIFFLVGKLFPIHFSIDAFWPAIASSLILLGLALFIALIVRGFSLLTKHK